LYCKSEGGQLCITENIESLKQNGLVPASATSTGAEAITKYLQDKSTACTTCGKYFWENIGSALGVSGGGDAETFLTAYRTTCPVQKSNSFISGPSMIMMAALLLV
jgi:hypothetical protein